MTAALALVQSSSAASDELDALLVAIANADGDQWPIADHLAAMPEVDENGVKWTVRRIADTIWDRLGVEWSASTISMYRMTAGAFPVRARARNQSFRAHAELRRAPEKLTKWVEVNPDKRLTIEDARRLKGPRSAAKAIPWDSRWGTLVRKLDALAAEDPSRAAHLAAKHTARYEAMAARRVKK